MDGVYVLEGFCFFCSYSIRAFNFVLGWYDNRKFAYSQYQFFSSKLVTYFRFIIKQLLIEESATGTVYKWFEMTFYIHRSKSKHDAGWKQVLLFCFDTPAEFKTDLIQALESTVENPELFVAHEKFMFELLVVEQFNRVYDISIWNLRTAVRNIEKVFKKNQSPLPAHRSTRGLTLSCHKLIDETMILTYFTGSIKRRRLDETYLWIEKQI
jgi:hypothetical protein